MLEAMHAGVGAACDREAPGEAGHVLRSRDALGGGRRVQTLALTCVLRVRHGCDCTSREHDRRISVRSSDQHPRHRKRLRR